MWACKTQVARQTSCSSLLFSASPGYIPVPIPTADVLSPPEKMHQVLRSGDATTQSTGEGEIGFTVAGSRFSMPQFGWCELVQLSSNKIQIPRGLRDHHFAPLKTSAAQDPRLPQVWSEDARGKGCYTSRAPSKQTLASLGCGGLGRYCCYHYYGSCYFLPLLLLVCNQRYASSESAREGGSAHRAPYSIVLRNCGCQKGETIAIVSGFVAVSSSLISGHLGEGLQDTHGLRNRHSATTTTTTTTSSTTTTTTTGCDPLSSWPSM